ncbi:MAG: 30S ribosomal protein S6 [Candidatus Yanofskybacteria bacterium CG10_big_fil_rev_8_21_14_0_10_46_23]|uniref:Small ribosomal subunit protein bS6 n=1 Tax=Candidatus Yanofskybacteria bacterium CG10_big_fil_rev_8_21_14_0_10_46_23 TaxID=1975098 RepID=A0A2H0R557_9BACT|nr:MAG: 30S ribosomal protein S6 [Candidatus Yanofskybacteria bacterium CG10_big_fil_rev_8_21_14_0_10_46_23]
MDTTETKFEVESRSYEVGFHLNSELDETEVATEVEELKKIITDHGGVVENIQAPGRMRLSYPIERKTQSFFGAINFKAPTPAIEELNPILKLHDKIIRFVILNKETQLTITRRDKSSKGESDKSEFSTSDKKKETQAKPEELDKQLDEVIQNIG